MNTVFFSLAASIIGWSGSVVMTFFVIISLTVEGTLAKMISPRHIQVVLKEVYRDNEYRVSF